MRYRNHSVDILKFFAAILITNSHMEMLYGKFSELATGGAMGDVLFFFCSGFTLFMGRFGRFDNWYKRRINRIYPTVFAWAILSSIVFEHNRNIIDIILNGGGWFISCIMIYYIIIYFIRKYLSKHMNLIIYTYGIICIFIFFLLERSHNFNMYGDTYYKWIHYFIFMLFGAIIGDKQMQFKMQINVVKSSVLLLINIILYYSILMSCNKWNIIHDIQILSIVPLIGVTYYFYILCNSDFAFRCYNSKTIGWIIKFIGGLCLEIYLAQNSLFTDKMNHIFPLNLIIMFILIVMVAYILRCLSRFFSQTFKDMDYNWKEVFKLI